MANGLQNGDLLVNIGPTCAPQHVLVPLYDLDRQLDLGLSMDSDLHPTKCSSTSSSELGHVVNPRSSGLDIA